VTQVNGVIKNWLSNHKIVIFPLLAFLIPIIIRTIPEILIGPYIIGFDTQGFYVPNALTWLHNGINLWDFLATAPLFYIIYMSAIAIAGSPVFLLKIFSPVLLGFLGLSVYAYAKRGLDWSPLKSLFVALLGTIYFVSLRASWDQLREELGLVFFFVVLMLLIINIKGRSWKRYATISLAMMAVVLSHQLMSVLMFGVIIATVAYYMFRKDFIKPIDLIVISLPATLYFVIFNLSGVMQSSIFGYSINSSPLASWTGFTSYQSMLTSMGGFFMYCYLPILPLVIIGLWRFSNLQLKSWLLLSLILVLLPLTSVSPYRWVLLLTYPLAFCTTECISKLNSIKWKRVRFAVSKIVIIYLILSTAVLSSGFIFIDSKKPFFYFNEDHNKYLYQIPSSMLQNTIPITDCQNTVNALQWFKNNVNNSALLLTHTVFDGWALLTLNENQVKSYGFDDPAKTAIKVAQDGYTQIYLIWWIKGQGWYAQPTLPSSFHEVYSSGKIAIYSFSSSS
jgi:hypothetical protein